MLKVNGFSFILLYSHCSWEMQPFCTNRYHFGGASFAIRKSSIMKSAATTAHTIAAGMFRFPQSVNGCLWLHSNCYHHCWLHLFYRPFFVCVCAIVWFTKPYTTSFLSHLYFCIGMWAFQIKTCTWWQTLDVEKKEQMLNSTRHPEREKER